MTNSHNTPFVSIIIPVYNAEKYIADAIIDVQNQTFKDFELFLIIDGATDKSGEICDAFAQQDSRISVIHFEKNVGVSEVRNKGIDIAQGKYLMFLDSDDRFAENMLEKFIEAIDNYYYEYNSYVDIVICGICEKHYDKNGNISNEIHICPEKKVLKTQNEIKTSLRYLEESSLYGYPWNKMYNLKKLKKSSVRFPKMKFNEDIIFNIDFFNTADTCIILDFMPYIYIKRINSSTTSRFIPTYYDDIMVKIDKLYKQFDEFGLLDNDNLTFIASRYVRYVFSAIERNIDKRSKLNKKGRRAFVNNVIKSERYLLLQKYMVGNGLSGIMAKNLKKGNVKVCLFIGRLIYITKKYFPGIFSKIN